MADFQKNLERFQQSNTQVVALSVDKEEDAKKTVERHRLAYPVLHGLDAKKIAETTGAYIQEDGSPPYLHATGFILRPNGTIALVVYSSGAVGRLAARDTHGLIRYYQKHNY